MSVRIESEYAALLPWVEAQLGGRVVRCERQGDRRSGGRPAFFVDVERTDGETIRTYARMSRGMGRGGPFTLAAESAVLGELHAAGIAVPEPLGLCSEPEGLLLEFLPGEFDYATLEDDGRRDAIDHAFLAEIAKLHALDASRFEAHGLIKPTTAREFALNDLAHWERGFDRAARRPVPLLRFARNWLHAQVPPAPDRAVLVQGDTGPGQFLFEADRLTGIVDWEFAHLGDPMVDLAQIRARDWYNPGADLKKWLAIYADYAATPVDLTKLRYYYVKAMLITPLALAGIVHRMHPSLDHAEWYAQDVSYQRGVAEALAEAMAIPLEAYDPPDAAPSHRAPIFEIVEEGLRSELPEFIEDGFGTYRADLFRRMATYARNVDRNGAAFEKEELDELGELLGRRPEDVSTGEAALEQRLLEGPLPDREEEAVVRYFYRHTVREERLMAGALGAGEGAVRQPVE